MKKILLASALSIFAIFTPLTSINKNQTIENSSLSQPETFITGDLTGSVTINWKDKNKDTKIVQTNVTVNIEQSTQDIATVIDFDLLLVSGKTSSIINTISFTSDDLTFKETIGTETVPVQSYSYSTEFPMIPTTSGQYYVNLAIPAGSQNVILSKSNFVSTNNPVPPTLGIVLASVAGALGTLGLGLFIHKKVKHKKHSKK